MEADKTRHVFRWQEKSSDQLIIEIERMNHTLAKLARFPIDNSKESFRLCENPFFLKLCPRIVFNPDDKGLFKGMYIPLEYWKRFSADVCSKGPKGGRIADYDNIGRKFTNFQFINLVADAWIGTTISQSAFLADLIREVLQRNRTVTLAIHEPTERALDPIGEASFDALEIDEEEDNDKQEPPLRY